MLPRKATRKRRWSLSAKKRKQSEDSRALLEAYALGHDRCAICWFRKYRPGRSMQIHHITGRFGRQCHDHRNLILLCDTCHHAVHNRVPPPFNGLSNAHVLTAKLEEDGDLDLVFLPSLRRRKYLGYDPEPILQPYLDERLCNGGE